MMKKFNIFLFSMIFITIFVSCTNPLLNPSSGGESKNSYNIRCSIAQEFDDSNKVRTAFPSATGETFSYKVYLNCGSESFSQDVQAYDGTDFSIKVPHKGLWELRVYGAIHGDPVSSTQYILKSEKIYYLNVTDETPSPFQKIIVKPVMTSGVTTGTIDLQVEWDADTGITDAECVCPAIEALDGYNFQRYTNKAVLEVTDVPSGSYTVDFNFYKVEGEARILKYNATETINVYDGFTTDTWVKHGDDEHLVVSGTPATTTFKVTGDLVKKFLLSSIYVDSNVAADAIQTGSFVAPFKTFDQAWALVDNNFNNENMASCTIYLRGDSTEHKVPATSSYSVAASKKLTIKSWDASSPAVLVSEGSNTFFTVSDNGTLVLDNVVIDGNNVDRVNTVYGIDNSGSVDLINTTIRNFKISSVRYTINVGATGSLSVSGKTVIIDNVSKNNGNKRNIYIPTGAVLTVKGITSDSRIGISVPSAIGGNPSPDTKSPVVFTSGYVAFNSLVKTDEVFISDQDNYPAVDPSTGEAALYASGGRIVKNGYDMIEIKCLKSKIVNPTSANKSGRTVLFNLYNNTTGEDLTSEATWNFTVKYLGADLPKTTYWTSSSNSVVFEENLGYDIYNIAATATVDGLSYTTTHDVEVCQINSVASLGETAPTATAASPVTLSVSTQAELKKISDWTRDQKHLENVTIILEKDIECTNYQSIGAFEEGGELADSYTTFNGTLDGNGHTITIKSFDTSSKALIAGTSGAVIKNLILAGDILTNKNYVCGFVLTPNDETVISNCINKLNIESTGHSIYGFTATGQTSDLSIERCRNEGNLTGTRNVAGIGNTNVVGGSIVSCVNTGKITGTTSVGGIISSSSLNVLNCINRGEVTGSESVGGIAGNISTRINTSNGKIVNCLNVGLVTASTGKVGGIVGVAGSTNNSFKKAVLQNCVNLGPVFCTKTDATSVGNIIGSKYDDNEYTIKNNFYLDQNSYKGIGGTDDDLSTGFETTAFIQTKASCVAYVPNSAYGASSKDVVDMLNIWIKSASGGNDSSFKTYVKWVYKTDSSGKAYPYLAEVK